MTTDTYDKIKSELFNPETRAQKLAEFASALTYLSGFGDVTDEELRGALTSEIAKAMPGDLLPIGLDVYSRKLGRLSDELARNATLSRQIKDLGGIAE